MHEAIVVNGQRCTSLDVRDRGLAYGHGVFETMRLWDGQLPLWHYHRQRLVNGLTVLGIPCNDALIDNSLRSLLDDCEPAGVVKLTVTAGVTGRGYAVQQVLEPTVIAQWQSLPAVAVSPVGLHICNYRLPNNPILAGVKHLNRLDQVLASREVAEAVGAGANQKVPLLLDTEDRVIEALSHNIFVYHQGRWLTPMLNCCGVEGVIRTVLLQKVIGEAGQAVSESQFGVDVLSSADEVFICNSVVGILPVSSLSGDRSAGVAIPDNDRHNNAHFSHTETAKIKSKLREIYPCYAA